MPIDNTDINAKLDELTVAATTPTPMVVEFKNCHQSFTKDGKVEEFVKDVSFRVDGNETIAILGPSGCGKSTLLRMLSGVYPRNVTMPTLGTVTINGEVVTGPRDEVLTVWQTPVMNRWMTVLGNVMLSFKPLIFGPRVRNPLEIMRDVAVGFVDRIPGLRGKFAYSAPYQEIRDQSLAILDVVGLSDAVYAKPRQLSGGMKQRAAIATKLAIKPPIVCMDEPFSALDGPTRMDLRGVVKSLKDKYPCMIFFVTHDVSEALDVADRILVMATRPATILTDIRLPPQKDRPADWATSLEHARLEASILQMIKDARANGKGGGDGNIRVSV